MCKVYFHNDQQLKMMDSRLSNLKIVLDCLCWQLITVDGKHFLSQWPA